MNRPPPDEVRERENLKKKAKKQLHHAEEEGTYLWNYLSERLLRPGVAGGLIGIGMSTFLSPR